MSRKQPTPSPYKPGDIVIRPALPPTPPKIPDIRIVFDDDRLARKIRSENRGNTPSWLQKLFARFN